MYNDVENDKIFMCYGVKNNQIYIENYMKIHYT